jgi:hypothetical protein
VPIGDLGECAAEVYDGLGGPEEALFSSERIFSLVVKELRLRVAQLSFTDQEIFSAHVTDTPQAREQPIPAAGQEFVRPAFTERAEDAAGAASGYFSPLALVSLRALDSYPVDAVAVYFDQTSGQWLYRLNYDPDGVQVINFWHDPLQVVQVKLSTRPNFPSAFNEVIADGATLHGLPELWEGERRLARIERRKADADLVKFIDMKSVMLRGRIDDWQKLWDWYRFAGPDKEMGLVIPYNAGRGGWRANPFFGAR